MRTELIFFIGHLTARREGGLFLGYFYTYIAYLILAETNPAFTRTFGVIVSGFVMPLTVIALAVTVVRTFRGSPKATE